MRLINLARVGATASALAMAVVGALAQTQSVGPFTNVPSNGAQGSTTPPNEIRTVPLTTTGPLGASITAVNATLTKNNTSTLYWPSDAAIRVQNSAFASTVFGVYRPFAGNNTGTWTTVSTTNNGTMTGSLVGQNLTAGSNLQFEFYNSFNPSGSTAPRATWDTVGFTLNFVAPPPPSTFIDAGTFSTAGNSFSDNQTYVGNQVRWYRFVTTQATAVNAALNGFGIRMWTSNDASVNVDTELGIYNNGGGLIASNDDRGSFGTGGSLWSWMQFGATGNQNAASDLPAGTYWVAAVQYNATFSAGFVVTTDATATNDIRMNFLVPNPPAPPSSFIDLGNFGTVGDTNSDNQNVATIRWYRFVTTQATVVNAALNGFGVRMWTSSDIAGNPDTELGLYDNNGALVGNNDNRGSFGSGGASLSWMQFGATGNQNVAAATNLAAGTYWLAAGLFNTSFSAGWEVGTSATTADEFRVNVLVPTPPAPPSSFVNAGTFSTTGDNFSDLGSYSNGVIRWYRFTTTQATVVNAALNGFGMRMWTTDDDTSTADTEIAVYDPNGLLLATNDNRGSFGSGNANLSWIQIGASGNQNAGATVVIPAGDNWLAAGLNDSTFSSGWNATGGGTLPLSFRVNFLVPSPPAPPGTFTDAGTFTSRTYTDTVTGLAAGEVKWYRLQVDTATAIGGFFMEFGTDPSGTSPSVDTEVGIYDNNGVLLASNDDNSSTVGSPSPWSFVRWGGASNVNVGGGSNPATLAPGTYWVAMGRFNVTYANGWNVISAGIAVTDPIVVTIRGGSPATTVTGTVSYPLWGPGLAGYPVTVDLRQGSTVVQSFNTTLDGSGGFSVAATAPAGNYDVYVRGPRLAWKVGAAPVTVGGAAQNAGSFAPRPGDIVQDNFIDGLDLAALDASFNLALGDAGFNPLADLNGDEVVDGLDLAILDANFNEQGDGDLP